jgi:hypothetical protein
LGQLRRCWSLGSIAWSACWSYRRCCRSGVMGIMPLVTGAGYSLAIAGR